ncbi:MAG: hypothetical protein GXO23_04130 [Crenarchaeota archaeon]|nr:hypothetical protein [Thermoproteota archaeon]
MPTRSRKKKSEEKPSSLGITAFLLGEEESKKEEKPTESTTQQKTEEKTAEKSVTKSATQPAKTEEDVEAIAEKIVELIKKRGGLISRDELVTWAKTRGIKLSTLMKAVEELTKRKVIVRRIVDEKLCYELRT